MHEAIAQWERSAQAEPDQPGRPAVENILQPALQCDTKEKLVDMLVYIHYWLYDRPAGSGRLANAQLIEDRLLGGSAWHIMISSCQSLFTICLRPRLPV